MISLKKCNICPRKCKVNRLHKTGFCGINNKLKVAKVCLVDFEEPCISFKNGSGAIFFSGCNLKCVFCQNHKISSNGFGKEITINQLVEIIHSLEAKKADNINLITPSHFTPLIAKALKKAKPKIPVIYNSNGYESVKTLKLLKGLVDIYLPDFKYGLNEVGLKYSKALNYVEVALPAIKEMVRQTKNIKFLHSKKLMRGVIVRHLVLPNNLDNTFNVLEILKNNFKANEIIISLMGQYTPLYNAKNFNEINRRLNESEYKKALDKVKSLPFDYYSQQLSSSGKECIPTFDLTGF